MHLLYLKKTAIIARKRKCDEFKGRMLLFTCSSRNLKIFQTSMSRIENKVTKEKGKNEHIFQL